MYSIINNKEKMNEYFSCSLRPIDIAFTLLDFLIGKQKLLVVLQKNKKINVNNKTSSSKQKIYERKDG
jgi:hypothetical protein